MKNLLLLWICIFAISCTTQEEESSEQMSIIEKGRLVEKLLNERGLHIHKYEGQELALMDENARLEILGKVKSDEINSLFKWQEELKNMKFSSTKDINYIPLTRNSSREITIRGSAEEEEKGHLFLSMKVGLTMNNDGVNVGETTAEGRGFDEWKSTTSKTSGFNNNKADVGAKGEVFRYAGGGMSASMDFYMTGYVTKSGESLTDGLIEHFRAGSEYYDNIK